MIKPRTLKYYLTTQKDAMKILLAHNSTTKTAIYQVWDGYFEIDENGSTYSTKLGLQEAIDYYDLATAGRFVFMIENHPQFTSADYEYLSDKGYTDAEIIEIWAKDHWAGREPATLNKNKISWPSIYNYAGRNFSK